MAITTSDSIKEVEIVVTPYEVEEATVIAITTIDNNNSKKSNDNSIVVADEIIEIDDDEEETATAAVMLKVPASRLADLREAFEEEEDGLNIIQFLESFTNNMDLDDEKALLKILPDLVDFFELVDVNGDAHMEWSEFVMFVIEQVVQEMSFAVVEKLEKVDHQFLQPTSSRVAVKSCKYMHEFQRLFIGVNNEIQLFGIDELSSCWLTTGFTYKLIDRDAVSNDKKSLEERNGSRIKPGEKKIIDALDMVYLGSKDILFVLRSDLSVDFLRFMSRTKLLPETISLLGFFTFPSPFSRIQIRDIAHEPFQLFAIAASSSNIYCWEIKVSNEVSTVDLVNQQFIKNHTDVVRDILVIHNNLYNLFVSAGMDGKIHIFDLVSLRHRGTRSGFESGVNCLAYDGRSVLLGGSFDNTIIGWDLNAEIDKPLFSLWGHTSPIIQIVGLGGCDRAISLDLNGIMNLWDTSKVNPNDKEDRRIETFSCFEDKIKCFGVFQNVSRNFKSHNDIILVAHGRRQHTYKCSDYTPLDGPTISVLYSEDLKMIISVHKKSFICWSAITGELQRKLSNFGEHTVDYTCACLDDRLRKLLIGDTDGVITVYNCITGVALKKFPPMPSIVRFIIYSPDKTVIAIGGSSDLFVFDELPNDPDDPNFFLRSTKAGDIDIVAISYSHRLGLIAVADCLGKILIFDYEFISLEVLLDDAVGSEIGQIAFLDPLPLLIITDNFGNYTIISVEKSCLNIDSKKKLWRLETQVGAPLGRNANWGRTDKAIITLGEINQIPGITRIRNALEESEKENIRKQEIGFDLSENATQTENNTPRTGRSTRTNNSSHTPPISRIENGLDGIPDHRTKEVISEDFEDENAAPKPFSMRKMNKYLLTKRNVTSIKILCESTIYKPEKKIGTAESALKMKKAMEKTLRKSQKESFEEDSDDSDDSDDERDRLEGVEESVKIDTVSEFPKLGFNMHLICGYEDGTISIVDLTLALLDINIGLSLYEADKRPNYDPRKKVVKTIGFGEIKRGTWINENIIEMFTNCRLFKVWAAAGHTSITTVDIVGDDLNVITAANDSSIVLWDRDGIEVGAITKGKEFDKLFKPHWSSLLNVEKRNILRQKQAVQLINALHLKIRDTSSNSNDETKSVNNMQNNTERRGTLFDTNVDYNLMPDRQRVIGQMNGNITYDLSNRDHAQLIVTQKTADFRKKFQNIGNDIKKKKIKTAVNPFSNNGGTHGNFGLDGRPIKPDNSNEEGYSPYEESRYMNEVLYDSKHPPNYEAHSSNNEKKGSETNKKKKVVKTKYDLEISEIDASDPNNWEIFSKNRQKAMYGSLHRELEKMGVSKDKMKVFVHKLNALCPNYDFVAFANKINIERTKAKNDFNEGQEQRKLKKETKRTAREEKLKLEQTNELRLDLSFSTKIKTLNLGDSISKQTIIINSNNNSDESYNNSPYNMNSNSLTPVKLKAPSISFPSLSLSPKEKDILQTLNENSNFPKMTSPINRTNNLSSNSHTVISHDLSPIRTNITVNTSTKNSPVTSSKNTPTSLSCISNKDISQNSPVSNSSLSSSKNTPAPSETSNSISNSPLHSKFNSPAPTDRSPLSRSTSTSFIGLNLPILVTNSSNSSKGGSKSNSKNQSPRLDTDDNTSLVSMMTDDNQSLNASEITNVTNMSMLSKSLSVTSIGNMSYKTNASSSWKGPHSTPKPTNTTRNFLEESINKFETSLATAEANFKIARKKQRKIKKKKKDEQNNNNSSSFEIQRHLTANLLLENCSSIDDISILDYKQQMVENEVNRKVQLALKNDFKLPIRSSSDLDWNFSAHLYLEDGTKSKPEKNDKSSIKSKNSSKTAPSNAGRKQNTEEADKKIALKTQFGAYQAKDLLKFYVVWEMLPKYIKERGWDGNLPLRPGVIDKSVKEIEIKENIATVVSESEDEDDDDNYINFNDETSNVSSLTGNTSISQSMSCKTTAVKKEKTELSSFFSPKDAASLNTAVKEEYAIDDKRVLARLDELLKTTFMKNQKDFTLNLEKCMNNRLSSGIERSKIEICLLDCLISMCPHMTFRECKDCIRYFYIKTRAEFEKRDKLNALAGMKKVQILTEDQIAQMKAMFKFFDKDDSDSVSKAEINAALADKNKQEKLAKNDAHNMSGGDDLLTIDATDISGSAMDNIIAEVDEDDDAELDFDEFVRLFKDELLF